MAISAPTAPTAPALPTTYPRPAAAPPLPPSDAPDTTRLPPLNGGGFAHLDRALEVHLGADLRLIYGLGMPILVLLALMIPMFAFPSYWLDGAVMLAVVICMGVIVMQVMALLEEPADAVTDFTGPDAPTRRA